MLTNEEIEQMKGVVRKCIYGIPDSEGQVARDTLDKIVAELLTLREAVSPQMAEVDALQDPWVGQPFVDIVGTFRNMRYLTRTAILACEREKQRADDAEAKGRKAGVTGIMHAMNAQCLTINQQEKQIESLTAQLSAIRDAGDEDVELLHEEVGFSFGNPYVDQQKKSREALEGIRLVAIARGQTRTDAVNKAAEWSKECEGLQEQISTIAAERDRLQKELDWERKCHIDEFTERMITQEESRDTYEALRKVEAERDEARGLLKKCHEVFREEMEQAKDCADWAESYRRILEIVEGK